MSNAQNISPLPGTFYRKTTPERPPFKQDGEPVRAADVIGLVEHRREEGRHELGGIVGLEPGRMI